MARPHLRVLMLGDVIGSPGRGLLHRLLRSLQRQYAADLTIANGENSAAGRGITIATAQDMVAAGVDVITSGNHIWRQQDIVGGMQGRLPLVRPINYPAGAPGQGWHTVLAGETRVTIVNALGRTFMEPLDNPFLALDRLLASPPGDLGAVLVDFHAEATSEKRAMGWYLDGRVAAVVGTHTHVPTADAQVLPNGTAYVTDVGMCGPRHSVIGVAIEASVERFVTQRPTRYEVAREGPLDFNAVLIEIDRASGRGVSIRRVDRVEQPTTPS
jgi:2',3'-cyclic-nucleotide 2'-phosphodiesterase